MNSPPDQLKIVTHVCVCVCVRVSALFTYLYHLYRTLIFIFQCFLSLLYLIGNDMWVLINYMSFVQWLSVGMSILGMLYLRYKRPEMPRPIKVCYLGVALSVMLMAALWLELPASLNTDFYVMCSNPA